MALAASIPDASGHIRVAKYQFWEIPGALQHESITSVYFRTADVILTVYSAAINQAEVEMLLKRAYDYILPECTVMLIADWPGDLEKQPDWVTGDGKMIPHYYLDFASITAVEALLNEMNKSIRGLNLSKDDS